MGLAFAVSVTCQAQTLNPPSPSGGIGYQPPQAKAEQHKPEANPGQTKTRNPTLVAQVGLPLQGNPKAAQKTSEKDKNSADWWLVKLTGLLAAIGAIQAVVFWVQAGRLKETIDTMKNIDERQAARNAESIREMARSATATEAANSLNHQILTLTRRPWIRVSIKAASSLSGDRERGVSIDCLVGIENSGNSPARNIRFHIELFARTIADSPFITQNRQHEVAKELREQIPGIAEGFLFNGDKSGWIQRAHIASRKIPESDSFPYIEFSILGCIDYQFLYSEEHHQTWFCYDIVRMDRGVVGMLLEEAYSLDVTNLALRESTFAAKHAH